MQKCGCKGTKIFNPSNLFQIKTQLLSVVPIIQNITLIISCECKTEKTAYCFIFRIKTIYFAVREKTNKNNITMNSFKKYLGAIVVILGAILLICSFFLGWNNNNGVQIGALVIMIAGLLLHIFLGKKA